MNTFDQITRILSSHRGKASAIKLADIADQVGTIRRDVETLIEEHLSEFPWPIVSGASGLFIPQDAGEINSYLHSLHSRHRKMQLREATVRRKARLAGYPEESGKFRNRPIQQELFS